MDTVSTAERSRIMSRVGSKDTQPEILVRKTLHAMGFRFRLHNKSLSGKPDLVLRRHKTVVFVHGCFWHHHDCPKGQSMPKTNVRFWRQKIQDNVARDARVIEQLERQGWNVIIIWECEIGSTARLQRRLLSSLPLRKATKP